MQNSINKYRYVKNILTLLFSSLFLVSCSQKIKEHKLKKNPVAYSCNEEHYVKHFNRNNLHQTAKNSFIYAIMSSNTYKDNPYFKIEEVTNWEKIDSKDGKKDPSYEKGFSADIYEKRNGTKIEEVVIAFRGTDDLNDMTSANLMISKGGQFKDARNVFEEILRKEKYIESKKIATGHSLGGGLAIHVSSRYDNVNAFVFNTSPQMKLPKKDKIKNNTVVSIREKGEILYVFDDIISKSNAKKILEKTPNKELTSKYDFFTNGLFGDHGIYGLARGLTLMAAVNGNETAINIQNHIADCNFKK